MRKLLISVVALSFALPAFAADHRVRGYTRKDGTYVAPHYKSNPNTSRFDNYSTKGNINPYTGKQGTVDPYAPKKSTYVFGEDKEKDSNDPY